MRVDEPRQQPSVLANFDDSLALAAKVMKPLLGRRGLGGLKTEDVAALADDFAELSLFSADTGRRLGQKGWNTPSRESSRMDKVRSACGLTTVPRTAKAAFSWCAIASRSAATWLRAPAAYSCGRKLRDSHHSAEPQRLGRENDRP